MPSISTHVPKRSKRSSLVNVFEGLLQKLLRKTKKIGIIKIIIVKWSEIENNKSFKDISHK